MLTAILNIRCKQLIYKLKIRWFGESPSRGADARPIMARACGNNHLQLAVSGSDADVHTSLVLMLGQVSAGLLKPGGRRGHRFPVGTDRTVRRRSDRQSSAR